MRTYTEVVAQKLLTFTGVIVELGSLRGDIGAWLLRSLAGHWKKKHMRDMTKEAREVAKRARVKGAKRAQIIETTN